MLPPGGGGLAEQEEDSEGFMADADGCTCEHSGRGPCSCQSRAEVSSPSLPPPPTCQRLQLLCSARPAGHAGAASSNHRGSPSPSVSPLNAFGGGDDDDDEAVEERLSQRRVFFWRGVQSAPIVRTCRVRWIPHAEPRSLERAQAADQTAG